jgi:glutamate-1-semialdehyde 2,1-aminomutase
MPTILEKFESTFSKDRALSEKAQDVFPDGVTHDNRHADPFPLYVTHADGSKKYGLDDREYIDYWCGHGALLLSHNPPEVVEAVSRQISKGTHYGASHELEIEWGQWVKDLIPSAERVRFVNSGTEATLMAIRLARTFTGRNNIVKFSGHFHGWHDSVIPAARPPLDTPVPGIPQAVLDNTIVLPPNDIDAVRIHLAGDEDVAILMIEPTGGGWGAIPCTPQFLADLRQVTEEHGVILLFDEVITGFRVSPGGAQAHYGITPDMTTMAKILAGGLPGGACAGRADIMDLISIKNADPKMKMPHPGTFNANPLSASAGIETLKIASTGEPQAHANETAASLRHGLARIIDQRELGWGIYGEFSSFRILIDHGVPGIKALEFDPLNYDINKLKSSPRPDLMRNLRCGMLLNGVDLPGTPITMAAHSDEDVQKTLGAFETTLDWMKADGLT